MIVIGYDLVSYLLHYPSARCDYTGKQGQASCFLGKSPALRVVFSRKTLHSLIPTFLGTRNENDRCDRMLQEIAGKVWKKEDELKQLKSELAALDRKIQLELAPPTPETSEKENEGQKPLQQDRSPQIRSTMQTSAETLPRPLSNHVIIARPGIRTNDGHSPKGMKF